MSRRKIGAIEAANEVIKRGYFGVPAGRRIDVQSAHAIITVSEHLSEENRAKLDAMPVKEAAMKAWNTLDAAKQKAGV